MKADFWHERWEKNQIGFHQQAVNSYLSDFWGKLDVEPDAKVFVPLCGKSSDMLWLRSQGYQVLGIELSEIAVRDFFADNELHAEVTTQGKFQRWAAEGLVILQGDFFDLTADDLVGCAAVFDRAALIALPPEMRASYAQHFQKIVPSTCNTLLVTIEYDQSTAGGPPFSVPESEVRSYYERDFSVELLQVIDALNDLPNLKKRGVPKVDEKAYLLTGNSN